MFDLLITIAKLYYVDLLFLLIVLVGSLIGYKTGNKQFVKQLILALVVNAEKQLGSKTGELKYNDVITTLYSRMPTLLRILYSKEQIDQLIEDAVQYLKRYLAEGKTLYGYDVENIK